MSKIKRLVSVAPMMDCTDRHERFFLRLISKNVLLYTEMVVSEAIDRGDKEKLLSLYENSSNLFSVNIASVLFLLNLTFMGLLIEIF